MTDTVHGGPKKRNTLRLFISLPIIDRFSKFFHWHTLRTICIYNDNNKHFGKIEKNTSDQINIRFTANGLYDTKLCRYNTVKCHIRIIYHNVGLKSFFIYLIFCYYP